MKYPAPELTADTKRNRYVLADDYRCPLPGHSCFLQVAKGQHTDGASIPRAFWILIGHPFTPDYSAASFVHDCLYAAHLFTRRQSDEIFRRILLATVSKTRARVMWAAVRSFGWLSWRRHPSSVAAARERIDVTTYSPAAAKARNEMAGVVPNLTPDAGDLSKAETVVDLQKAE